MNTAADSNGIPTCELTPDAYTTAFVNNVETPPPQKKTYTMMILQGAPCIMEVYSGSKFTLLSEEIYNSLGPRNHPPIMP